MIFIIISLHFSTSLRLFRTCHRFLPIYADKLREHSILLRGERGSIKPSAPL